MLFPINPHPNYFNPIWYYGLFGKPRSTYLPTTILESLMPRRPWAEDGSLVSDEIDTPFLHDHKGRIVVDEKGRIVLPHYFLLPSVMCKAINEQPYHNFEDMEFFNTRIRYNTASSLAKTLYTDGRVYLPRVYIEVTENGDVDETSIADRSESSYYYPRRSYNGSSQEYEYDCSTMSDSDSAYTSSPHSEASFQTITDAFRERWRTYAMACALPPRPLHFADTELLGVPLGYSDGSDTGEGGYFAYRERPSVFDSSSDISDTSSYTDYVSYTQATYYDNHSFDSEIQQEDLSYIDDEDKKVSRYYCWVDMSYSLTHYEYASVSYYGFVGLNGEKRKYVFKGQIGFKGYSSRNLRVKSAKYVLRLYVINPAYHTKSYITDSESNVDVARKFPKFELIKTFTLVEINEPIDSSSEVIFDAATEEFELEANRLYAWEAAFIDVEPLEVDEPTEITYGDGSSDAVPTSLLTEMTTQHHWEASIRFDDSCTSTMTYYAIYD